jgi:DNA-binding CsgD family transcriptional regulator
MAHAASCSRVPAQAIDNIGKHFFRVSGYRRPDRSRKTAEPSMKTLRSAFALTPAEARLAARIASGATLEVIAAELRITKETARNELKAIFQKTKTHRQSELVAMLASLLSQPTSSK